MKYSIDHATSIPLPIIKWAILATLFVILSYTYSHNWESIDAFIGW